MNCYHSSNLFARLSSFAAVAVVLAVIVSGCNVARNTQSEQTAVSVSDTINRRDNVEFYFQNLLNRTYTPSEVSIAVDNIASNDLYSTKIISYVVDGLREYALVNTPAGSGGPFPVVVLNHGYTPPENYISGFGTRARDVFARSGFMTISPDYRGHGKSQGGAFNTNRYYYPVDVTILIKSLSNIPEADTKNVFLWGHSMGGGVSVKAAVLSGIKINGISLWAPVSLEERKNFERYLKSFGEDSDFSGVENDQDFWDKVSIGDSLGRLNSNIIIHHGTTDLEVPYDWTTNDLIPKLIKNKVGYELFTYEDEGHNFENGAWNTVVARDIGFFRKNLNR